MMSCSLIKSNRLGAYPWLKDEEHYTYRRKGEYKKSKYIFDFIIFTLAKNFIQLLFIFLLFIIFITVSNFRSIEKNKINAMG